jgi:hypothetical protein
MTVSSSYLFSCSHALRVVVYANTQSSQRYGAKRAILYDWMSLFMGLRAAWVMGFIQNSKVRRSVSAGRQ